jgi:hypothetical protein
VAQDVGPESKPQYCKKKRKRKKENLIIDILNKDFKTTVLKIVKEVKEDIEDIQKMM